MSVVITVDGRQAIPVRALPYVTNWKTAPDELAAAFCRSVETDFKVRIRSATGVISMPNRDALASYVLQEGGTIRKMAPDEWGFILVKIDCLTKKLQADERTEGENWAEWRRQATNLLPAAAFVWLDEFQTWFSNTRPLKTIKGDAAEMLTAEGDCDHCLTEHESDNLTLSPLVTDEQAGDIFEVFQQRAYSSALEKAAPPAPPWGVTKCEVLAVQWPMPSQAPPLSNILDEVPKWAEEACKRTGVRGKGAAGSHRWNPAILAFCLSTKTNRKKWIANKGALTNFLRHYFPDYLDEWERAVGKDD